MTKNGAPALRIVLYPGAKHSICAAHCLAALAGSVLALRYGLGGAWWMFAVWYIVAFLGTHVAMVPVMTLWHAASLHVERRVRAIIEEEMIKTDLQNYQAQLRRVFPGRSEPPSPDA